MIFKEIRQFHDENRTLFTIDAAKGSPFHNGIF
jgi:hypothetical protein